MLAADAHLPYANRPVRPNLMGGSEPNRRSSSGAFSPWACSSSPTVCSGTSRPPERPRQPGCPSRCSPESPAIDPFAAGQPLSGVVTVEGSSTVFPVSKGVADEFQKAHRMSASRWAHRAQGRRSTGCVRVNWTSRRRRGRSTRRRSPRAERMASDSWSCPLPSTPSRWWCTRRTNSWTA